MARGDRRADRRAGPGLRDEAPAPAAPRLTSPRGEPRSRRGVEPGLRPSLSTFIGRRGAVTAVARLLRGHRLVMLLGQAGIGKTRLALAVAAQTALRHAAGARLIELGAVSDAMALRAAVVDALELDIESDSGDAQIAAAVGSTSVLLVFDECEHAPEATAALVACLVERCPNLAILATSRERLGVPGEVSYHVPPLATPLDADSATSTLLEHEAVALFVDRARRARGDWAPEAADVRTIAEIVRRLDGLPLAIELAAAWADVLPPGELLQRLDRRFDLLVSRDRLSDARHASLLTALESTYESLPETAQVVFRRLALFAGGWTLHAMSDVCDLSETEAIRHLGLLVDRSLVTPPGLTAAGARYRLLDTLRDFALVKVQSAGELEDRARRFALHYVALAEAESARLATPDAAVAARALDEEDANFRAVLALRLPSLREARLRLVNALADHWFIRGRLAEARAQLETAVAESSGPDTLRASALSAIAFVANAQARYADAVHASRLALRLARTAGAAQQQVFIRQQVAYCALQQRRLRTARFWARRTLETARGMDSRLIAFGHLRLGQVAFAEGDLEAAERELSESRRLTDQAGDHEAAIVVSIELGRLEVARGEVQTAEKRLLSILASVLEVPEPRRVSVILNALAAIAAELGDHARAARLAGIATAVLRDAGWAVGAEPTGYATAAPREYAEGTRMAIRPALAYALRQDPEARAPAPKLITKLTRRQMTVAKMVAEGLTNKEIAKALWISERTAEGHVEQLRNKLGAASRVQVGTWYLREIELRSD